MFDQEAMASLLHQATGNKDIRSLNEYGRQAGVSASYISRLQRKIVDKPPGAGVLRKLADASADASVTFERLMAAAGWTIVAGEMGSEKEKLIEYMVKRKITPKEADQILNILRIKQNEI